jgi:hypothetical protein
MEKEERLHRARAATIGALDRLELGKEEVIRGLADCRLQLEHKALIERVLSAAGYSTERFSWDEHMELYFDVTDGRRDAGYISKGWEDPGFRIAQLLTIPTEYAGAFKAGLEALQHKCATEGLALSTKEEEGELTIYIECVIYTAGFTAEAVAHCMRYLDECTAVVQDSLTASATDSLTA